MKVIVRFVHLMCFISLLQPIVKSANPSIVEPLLNLLKTLHLEVQYEGRYRS